MKPIFCPNGNPKIKSLAKAHAIICFLKNTTPPPSLQY